MTAKEWNRLQRLMDKLHREMSEDDAGRMGDELLMQLEDAIGLIGNIQMMRD